MSVTLLALAAGLLLGQTQTSTDAPPFTEAQLDYLEKLRDQIREETAGSGAASSAAPAAEETGPSRLELKAEVYMKWLYRNDATQGCVSYGNPHPTGDNYSGNNGACPEFALTLIGRPMAKIEGGFRLQSRYGMDFADWFENGDKKAQVDASGESLGQNHSAPIQLRGIYVRIAEPLPFIDWFLAGSSDLSYWDAFTVGKVRFIDRFNAKGLFLKSHVPGALDVLIARIALPKLFGSANYGSLEEPLVTNPFWARDAVYALQLATPRGLIDGVSVTANGDVILDEEADAADPDAPGSTNAVDKPDAVVSTAGRFVGVNASLGLNLTRWDALWIKGTFAFSYNSPNTKYVTNLARGGLGFTNIVNDTVADVAGVLRVELPDLLGEGRSLKAEYFNIGADFNSVMGSRREDDVLLTDGFLDGGELPTLNLANELIDFNDAFYESIIGWHGGTVVLSQEGDLLNASAEATVMTFNTNGQGRDMDIYPGFGAFTGYTDTQLFSYANTNDRGADPRAVYRKDQDRFSMIFALSATVKPSWWTGAKLDATAKLILDNDGRNAQITEDDYKARIFAARAAISGQPFEPLTATLGLSFDQWSEDARSGTLAGGSPRFYGYQTLRVRPYVSFQYSLGPLTARYHFEAVHKDVTVSDPTQSYQVGWVFRSVGWLAAQF